MDNVFVISDRSMVIAKGVLLTIVGLIFLTFPLEVGGWPPWIIGITACSIILVVTWWHAVGVV